MGVWVYIQEYHAWCPCGDQRTALAVSPQGFFSILKLYYVGQASLHRSFQGPPCLSPQQHKHRHLPPADFYMGYEILTRILVLMRQAPYGMRQPSTFSMHADEG